MSQRKRSVTYQEDPDILGWIEDVRAAVEAHRGCRIQRADVIRWLTRRGCQELDGASVRSYVDQI
jgi:hypothetical protein